MKEVEVSLPKIALVAATRAMLGAGVALLLGPKLPNEERKAIGKSLLWAGLLSTIPLMASVLHGRKETGEAAKKETRAPIAQAS
ncbi:MAG: hypothetical protein M9921_10360 [Fimbriimonadaceae bacterium]|nr:hypothetical protein [Chthonomonadaceae bacterium]MCO5297248.1 hypothetical protein [Fimbriimonadaceae bacterium]